MFFPTPRQMRTIEENSDKNGVSYRELMENAGGELAILIDKMTAEKKLRRDIVFLCGSGNNGGDGFVAAAALAENGFHVTVILTCGEPSSELAALEFRRLCETEEADVLSLDSDKDAALYRISEASVIADAVFGTGFHGFLPPDIRECFSYAAKCSGIKIAVDVPSGGDCLKGTVSEGTMECSCTLTFGYKKIGMTMYPLADLCGEIITADIGFTDECLSDIDLLPELFGEKEAFEVIPPRHKNSHKGDFGKLLNAAGCSRMSGAALLSTKAALKCGTGLVTLASSAAVIDRIASAVPEATYLPLPEEKDGSIAGIAADAVIKGTENRSAVSIGCGLSVTAGTKNIVKNVIKAAACPIILDADGINCISDNIDIIKDAKNKLIITPHAGELARIAGVSPSEAAADRLTIAVNISREYGVIVAAKGVPTFVVGEGKVYVIPAGNPGLSKGGSGDVLTGIIAGLCAQGIAPLKAAAAGVFLHGAAADIAAERFSMAAMQPSDVIECLSFVFKKQNR